MTTLHAGFRLFVFLLLASLFAPTLHAQRWLYGKYELPANASSLVPVPGAVDEYLNLQLASAEDWLNPFALTQAAVAFQAVAKPGASFSDIGFSVFYVPARPDGSRLVVVSGPDTLTAPLYDWQLIPLVRLADSDFNACISLSGPRSIRNSGLETSHIIYHPALHNTLLGARLLQAQLMLKDVNEFWKKPQYQELNSDPVILIGPGEPDVSSNWPEAGKVLQTLLSTSPGASWMLTDLGEEVRIGKSNGQLVLQGSPYFYCWQSDPGRQSIVYEGGNTVMVPGIEPLDALTASLKNKISYLEKYNPYAWQAAQNTMRYTAFFRYAKQKNPANWRRLVLAADTAMSPQIAKTPMSWRAR